MATFFGRKYARDQVPTPEVVIGVVVLLALGGIVAAVIAVVTRPQPSPFALEPGAEHGITLTRGQRIARQMMPELGIAGWSLRDGMEVLDGPALAAADEAELVEAGAAGVYRGVYANRASGETVSVEIIDAGTPVNAAALYAQRKPDGAKALAAGVEGWQTDAGRGAFWGGRHYTQFDCSSVRSAPPSAFSVAGTLGSAQIVYGAPSAGEVESPFPPIDVAGWSAPTEFRVYTPLNLWEKINGRADLYLQYGMQRMNLGVYRHESDALQVAEVFWYRMTAPDGAFGIYRAEFGGQVTKLDVGQDGYGVGGSVMFWKGCDYVRVEAAGAGSLPAVAGLAVARAIAARIEDAGGELWADGLLPREGRTGDELDYHGENAFSLDFLSEVFSADYAAKGKSFTAFIHRAADTDATAELLGNYEAFFKDYGAVLERRRIDGIEFLVGKSGGVVDAVFVSGLYLGGVNNTDDADFARDRALVFARAIATQDDDDAQRPPG